MNFKKLTVALLAFTSILGLTSCGGNDDSTNDNSSIKMAFIAKDTASLSDQSFSQSTWEAMKTFAKEANYEEPKSYLSGGEDDTQYSSAIDNAVSEGRNLIVLAGYQFSNLLLEKSKLFTEVKFIGIDIDGSSLELNNNAATVTFKENESGVLAGYAAVQEGKRKLSYVGGKAYPANKRFAIGYAYGAYQAAKELNLTDFNIDASNFFYLGAFKEDTKFTTRVKGLFDGGKADIVFACAGGANTSVFAATSDKGVSFIGVDVDQGGYNNNIITSAMKDIKAALQNVIGTIKDGTFKGGSKNLGINEGAVGIVDSGEHKRLSDNTIQKTNAFKEKVKNGELTVPATTDELIPAIEALGYSADSSLANSINDTK